MPRRYGEYRMYNSRRSGCFLFSFGNLLVSLIVFLVVVVLVAYYIMPYVSPELMQYLPDGKQVMQFFQRIHITISNK